MQRGENTTSSRGERWKLLHSLWIGWTFTLGLFSWISFIYIGIRARQIRWIVWGLVYFAGFLPSAITDVTNPVGRVTFPLLLITGGISIVHAFLVRDDYLVRLENQMQLSFVPVAGTTPTRERVGRAQG